MSDKKVSARLREIAAMLKDKNEKYGDSVLNPRIIIPTRDKSSISMLSVRLNDKLSRLANQNINEDEDVTQDIVGYLMFVFYLRCMGGARTVDFIDFARSYPDSDGYKRVLFEVAADLSRLERCLIFERVTNNDDYNVAVILKYIQYLLFMSSGLDDMYAEGFPAEKLIIAFTMLDVID